MRAGARREWREIRYGQDNVLLYVRIKFKKFINSLFLLFEKTNYQHTVIYYPYRCKTRATRASRVQLAAGVLNLTPIKGVDEFVAFLHAQDSVCKKAYQMACSGCAARRERIKKLLARMFGKKASAHE